MDAIELPVHQTRVTSSHRRGLEIAVVAIGIALGLAVAFGPRLLDRGSSTSGFKPATGAAPLASLSTRQVAAAVSSAGASIATSTDAVEPPAAAAPTPQAAVQEFVDAEVAGRYDVSYGLLSAADRARARTRVAWSAQHADLPPLTGVTVETVAQTGDTATVAARIDLRASLDEVEGLVPAHAAARWVAVREDDGWRLAYAQSRLEPEYPSASGATDAARTWVAARQGCHTAAEWSGGLVGSPLVARGLCGRTGTVRVGDSFPLPDDPSGAALAAAFGPDVYAWARVVPVTAPARIELIVAPVGEQWLVVAARTASASAP